MKFLKWLDGEMRPVRWIASLTMLCWYGLGASFMFVVDLPWFSIPFIVMALFAVWGVIHNSTRKYWYHDDDE